MKKHDLVIVSCGKRKLEGVKSLGIKIPAKYLYTSEYFNLCKDYAEMFAKKWVIFSAKYGILDPDELVEVYEQRLDLRQISEKFIKEVEKRLSQIVFMQNDVVSLCGSDYDIVLKRIIEKIGANVRSPLSRISIGKRMAILREALITKTPL